MGGISLLKAEGHNDSKGDAAGKCGPQLNSSKPGLVRHMQKWCVQALWLQKELADGKVVVVKVPGQENPADLMTKVLTIKEIDSRLRGMHLRANWFK